MKTYSIVICFIFLSLICGFGNALMLFQNDSQLILTSDQIVYGKIVDVKSQWNVQKTHIETTAQILVADAFKKSDTSISSGSTVPVTVLGGTVGDVTEWVEDMPVFLPGSDVFVYLNKRSDGKYSVTGLYQGVHTINNNKMGKSQAIKSSSSTSDVEKFKEKINKNLQGTSTDSTSMENFQTPSDSMDTPGTIVYSATVTTASPNTASAGTNTIITITGSGFGTKASRDSWADVRFLYRTDGLDRFIFASGWPYFSDNADDIVSWTDTQIKVKVPTGYTPDGYPGSASSGFLVVDTDSQESSAVVPFAVTFGYGKKKWNTPTIYYVNPGSVSGATTAVQNAATTWNNAIPGSSFRLNYGGPSTCTTFGNDGTSLIYFGPKSDFSSYPNVIAWASSWSSGGIITEADIEFNTGWTWTTGTASGSMMNVEAIVLHEQGHWLFLKDLYGFLPEFGYPGYPSDISPEKKVMFGYNGDSFGNKNLKTLSTADTAGIRWIYPHLTVIRITPSSGLNTGSVSITNLTGTNFVNGATVNLTRSGYTNISATGVTVVSPTKITCTLPITGKEPGQWNVVVINPDTQYGILNNGFTISSSPLTPTITVTAPNGGETWQRGTTHTVTWSYTGSPGSTVKIALLKAGTEVGTIKDSTSTGNLGTGAYTWPMATTGTTGSDFKVSVQSISLPTIKDTSNNTFNITPASLPSITVTTPNGGESWDRSVPHTITWDYTGNPGLTVKIVLLKAGIEVGTINASTSIGNNGKGSYSWGSYSGRVPGSDYKVSVQSISQPTIKDTSNNTFNITPASLPSITVTSPNGGETWQRGTTQTITWSYTGSPGSTVKIVLLKAGTEVGTIKDSTSTGNLGTGSYSWPIYPFGTTGSDYKVSVQSISQPTIKDTSNNTFNITPATTPTITVTAPNGGETWQRGTTQTITWSYLGSPGSTVKIVLLKAGTEVGTIKDNTSTGNLGTGSYSWSIYPSGTTGSDFKVSVQSINQPTVKDASNNNFTITL